MLVQSREISAVHMMNGREVVFVEAWSRRFKTYIRLSDSAMTLNLLELGMKLKISNVVNIETRTVRIRCTHVT